MKPKPCGKQRRRAAWELRLYVADTTPRSVLARKNLEAFCQSHLSGGYRLTIIDIVKKPDSARQDGIVATPTLIRIRPGPPRRFVGTLADTEPVLRAIGNIHSAEGAAPWMTQAGAQVGRA